MIAIAPDPVPMSSTRCAGLDAGEARFYQVLGFGARDQDVGRYAEIAAVEFLAAGDVLRGFALESLVEVAAVMDPGYFG